MKSIITRVCICGCEEEFKVPAKRPGQQYKFGHKPKLMRQDVATERAEEESKRLTLNYKFALATAEGELAKLTAVIENLKKLMEPA